MAEDGPHIPFVSPLTTRIIGFAWGDGYVDELLDLALPALLAPGNLPAVAAQVPCELVLVSEERLFAKIADHPAVREVQKLCPVRLVGLDDLITRSDKYGMALTYALHRAFVDLGPAMTDAWLIFFNADFIIADGSLSNLLAHLVCGERIVASPSYCTVKEDVVPELKRRLATDPVRLAIGPREMAKLILRHRHITISSKTINQSDFHFSQADQFYQQVDDNTLVGRQMPVAIVGMRPQRYLAEPSSFWDHGLMLELCPDAQVKLLGDSDEFLMLELRSGAVGRDQITLGAADPRDLAERMITWVTSYQASFAHRPLVLHSGDIPRGADAAQKELDAFVTKVLSYAPQFPSHLGHPQWDYHWPDFMKIRHVFLSAKLGSRTQTEAPPENMLSIDRLWWRLDGAEKTHTRRIELLTSLLQETDREIVAYAASVLDEPPVCIESDSQMPNGLFAGRLLDSCSGSAAGAVSASPGGAILDAIDRTLPKKCNDAEARKTKVRLAMAAAEARHVAGGSDELRRARREYDRLLQLRVKSAGIPIVYWRGGDERAPTRPLELTVPGPIIRWFPGPWEVTQELPAGDAKPPGEGLPRRVARKVYYRLFGRWPRVTMLNPFWACAQPVLAAIEAAKAAGARDALMVVDMPNAFLNAAAMPGKVAHISPQGLGSELFAKALDPHRQFDLCVLQLSSDDMPRLSELLDALAEYSRPGGVMVGFHMNGGRPVGAVRLEGHKSKVSCTGSAASMRASRVYLAARNRIFGSRPLGMVRGVLMLALSVPLALWANRAEAAEAKEGHMPDPMVRTSVTIMVHNV
jgi:hypothetical protein